MPGTNDKKQQFITLLHELFQLDQPELDFGFYKIMHAKSGQITRFIDEELSEHIDAVFAGRANQSAGQQTAEAREAVVASLGENAFDDNGELKPEFRDVPVGKQYLDALKAQREGGALSDDAQVYDHLYRFFSRYYDQGDFLSTRYRQAPSDTRDAPYSVPYDGREVYLHWANKDQYYIKSSETLRNYGFDLNAAVRQLAGGRDAGGQGGFGFGADHTPRRVHFQIVDAAEGAHGNVKDNEQRFFIIHDAEPIQLSENQLTIQFEYRPDPTKTGQNKKWQKTRLAEAEAVVLKALDAEGDTGAIYKQTLATPAPTAANENRTLLAKHLYQYTARHSMDYFIHKNLGGFLRRELDFYIKNEVMRLDHVESAEAPAVADYLEKVKVIRRIARRIIEFLAQLEDFQKKLWLKKKFVTETNYCITLDRIPEEFYPEIAANEQQVQEWQSLYSIFGIVGYTRPLEPSFLLSNTNLTVDTKNFGCDFRDRLVSTLEHLDNRIDGIGFHAENLQALNTLAEKFHSRIGFSYIDPPYNTEFDRETGKFIYKDGYSSSTWASLMTDRVAASLPLLKLEASYWTSIDDNEYHRLRDILDTLIGRNNFVSTLVWKSRSSVSNDKKISNNHTYKVLYSASDKRHEFAGLEIDERDYANPDGDTRGPWDLVPLDANKPGGNTRYGINNPNTGEKHYPPSNRSWAINEQEYERLLADNRIAFGLRGDSAPKRKLFYKERLAKGDRKTPISVWSEAETTQNGTTQLMSLFGFKPFDYPKPLGLLRELVYISSFDSGLMALDYFAGSGTTGHAVINLNREDGGKRKYILVEMGDYFDTVLKPRLQKAVFSKDWKDGKPKPDAEGNYHGVSHCFKYLRLESYEDALNNLVLHEDTDRDRALEDNDELRHDYMLRYWLDTETQGSASLLNVAQFKDPTNYRMKIKRPGGDESVEQPIDLVETFNWLLGLHVELLDKPRTFAAEFEREADPDLPAGAPIRLKVAGRLKEREDGGHWFRTVEGWVARTPGATEDVDKVLVIWRKLTEDAEQDTAALESLLANQLRINQRDTEFDAIYINGPHGLSTDFEGKHRLHSLEAAFHAAMWAED